MFNRIKGSIKTLWTNIRRLSGDDAYEQYLKHYAEVHTDDMDAADINAAGISKPSPLSREAFFKEWQDKKWKGVKRCC